MSKSPISYILAFLKLGLGIISIILCFSGEIVAANFLILGAVFIEGCGKTFAGIKELTDPVAMETNSISNMVSFSLSPAVCAWKSSLASLGITGYILLISFTICSTFQLARTNVKNWGCNYAGMPVTAAGSILLLDNISTAQFGTHTMLTALFILLLSYLMVSSIKIKRF